MADKVVFGSIFSNDTRGTQCNRMLVYRYKFFYFKFID